MSRKFKRYLYEQGRAKRAYYEYLHERDKADFEEAGRKLRAAQEEDDEAAQIAKEAHKPISKLWAVVFWIVWQCTKWRNNEH